MSGKLLDPGACVLMYDLLEHQRLVFNHTAELSTFDQGELSMINTVLTQVPNNTAEEWMPVLTSNGVLRSLIRSLLSDKILHYIESINHHMVDDDDEIVPNTCLDDLGCSEDDDDDVFNLDDDDDDDVAEIDDLFTEVDDDDILPATIADELTREAKADSEAFRDAQEFGMMAQAIIYVFSHNFKEDMDRPYVYLKDLYSMID